MKSLRRLAALGAAVALIAVACGGGTPVGADVASLPPHASAACEAGASDCEDVPSEGSEPLFVGDEPDLGVKPDGGSAGMVVGGGLTVEEALETDATGVIAVQGFIVNDESGTHLCDLLAESRPPLCGGASIEVSDLGTVDPDELTSAQGVEWTDRPITLLGEIIDGVLVPTPFSE